MKIVIIKCKRNHVKEIGKESKQLVKMLVATQKRNRVKVIRKDCKQFVKILVLKLKRSCIKVIRKRNSQKSWWEVKENLHESDLKENSWKPGWWTQTESMWSCKEENENNLGKSWWWSQRESM